MANSRSLLFNRHYDGLIEVAEVFAEKVYAAAMHRRLLDAELEAHGAAAAVLGGAAGGRGHGAGGSRGGRVAVRVHVAADRAADRAARPRAGLEPAEVTTSY